MPRRKQLLLVLLLGFVGTHFSTVMSSQWIARAMFLQLTVLRVAMGPRAFS